MDNMLVRVKTNQIKPTEYDSVRLALEFFESWIGPEFPVESIDVDKWEDWWNHLLESKLSVEYKKKRLSQSRNFVQWLAERGIIAMPLNLRSRKQRFKGGHKAVKPIPLDEVRHVIGSSEGQLRLHRMALS